VSRAHPSGDRRLRLATSLAAGEAQVRAEEALASRWEATLASKHGRRDYWLRRALVAADLLGVTGALVIAFTASAQHDIADIVWLLPVLPLWVGLFGLYGLYGRDVRRIGQRTLDDLPWLFHALLLGALAIWGYYRLLPVNKLTFSELVAFGAGATLLIIMLRSLTRHVATSIFGPERVLLIGEAQVTSALIRKMTMHPEYALQPIGLLSRNRHAQIRGAESAPPLPILGHLGDADILELIQLHNVERVIVSQEDVDDSLMIDLFRDCGRLQVKVSVLPRGVDTMGPSMEIDDIEGVTVLGLNPLVLSRSSRVLKRSMDVAGASIGLLLLSPLMVFAAIVVKFTSPGPIFFRQIRIGRSGEPFTLYKFRTMVHDADSRTAELMAASQDPHWLKLEHDPRITWIGRFLRLFSIDELPQLWSVLVGKMSLVGPRPLSLADHEQIEIWARIRLDIAPGITGLWQVLGRTNIPFEEMIKLDCLYVTNWSLWMDLRLLIKTIPAVAQRRGAN